MARRLGPTQGWSQHKALEPVPNVHQSSVVTADNLYWKSYEFPTTIQEFGAISHIDIQPTYPHDIAVSTATRIQVYCQETFDRKKTFSRFHDTVYGASYRHDGKLIVAGNEDCNVRLFDNEGRVPLRIFKGHSRPVHVSKFCNNLTHIFTAGDDKTVRVWDVATESTISTFSEHEDYIRTGATCRSSADIIASGSYDHTVKLYDTRTNSSILSVDHGQPVESILIYPSGSLLLSAGGNSIKVWDILQGGRLLTTFSHHHKTITCLAFNHDCSRLLSGSLDRHVKLYNVATYDVVHNIDYSAPILSLAVGNEDKTLAVGMLDKMLSLKKRKKKKSERPLSNKKRKLLSTALHEQTKSYAPNEDDIVIYHAEREYLPKYDFMFRKFQHSRALDSTLAVSDKPEVTVAVFKELIRRKMLRTALVGRTGNQLIKVLRFLLKNITKVSFAPILLEVANALVDLYYADIHEHDSKVQALFIQMREIIKNEVELHREMYSVMGCVHAILASHSRTGLPKLSAGDVSSNKLIGV